MAYQDELAEPVVADHQRVVENGPSHGAPPPQTVTGSAIVQRNTNSALPCEIASISSGVHPAVSKTASALC